MMKIVKNLFFRWIEGSCERENRVMLVVGQLAVGS